jgi:hypothetical protein
MHAKARSDWAGEDTRAGWNRYQRDQSESTEPRPAPAIVAPGSAPGIGAQAAEHGAKRIVAHVSLCYQQSIVAASRSSLRTMCGTAGRPEGEPIPRH